MSKAENDTYNQIYIDLKRTSEPLFSPSKNAPALSDIKPSQRILFALCCRRYADMDYCQGLNYLASTFFKVIGSEHETFEFISEFIKQNNLKGMYVSKVYEYHLRNFMLKELIRERLPDVWTQITKKMQINIEMITTQWVMTMFLGYIQEANIILPILDNFVLHSWLSLFPLILAFFKSCERQILRMNDIS